ncbi:uncharacterized protein TNCT_140703 [Trichonephila clavata]|uniref:Pericentriolar material 1 protein n=1 Tax=Trichonephila clavata TaxID=2740835 RepID=A0A8X6JIW2_TRICU|nr:uncharacterized protein TNCT_140703 [Trichonephila clavata]
MQHKLSFRLMYCFGIFFCYSRASIFLHLISLSVSFSKKSIILQMASGESQSPLKGPKLSASSSSSRNDCDETPWMLLPNNLEISSRSKPSKKQRNKEKLRGFPEDRATSNMTERLSSSPVGFQNFTRAKCNTASWLKDQLVNDKKTRKRICDSEEVFSDADLAQSHSGTLNFPASHSIDVPEHPEELPRPQSRRSIVENENTKSVKEECIKNETDSAIVFERLSQLQDFISEATSLCQELEINDEPVMREEFGKIKKAMKQVADGEREHKMLLQQMVSENGAYAMNGILPSSSGSKAANCAANISYRDSNGSAVFCNEEEHNKCNHLLEKMKQSEERLMSLKMQESLLYSMQRKAENKLATFEAPEESHPDDQEESNGEDFWNFEVAAEQRQWLAEKTLQAVSFNEEEKPFCGWNEPQDIKQLHVSLERIRKRVQSMQQNPDIKNMTRSLSSDDCEIGERVAAVEFERKKLKNKLMELQEKKKMNDELLQELSFLKDAAHADAAENDDGPNFASASPKSSHSAQLKDKKRPEHSLADADRKLYRLQSTLRHLEGMIKTITPDEIIQNESPGNEPIEAAMPRMETRNTRSGTCNKRDNVRKEINSGFPARRHYEAEGRANEDADIPTLPTSSQPPNLIKWREFSKMREKLRKLQAAEKHVKVIYDIMNSIREAKKSGRPIKDEHLQLLSSLERQSSHELEKDQSSSNSEEEEVEYVSVPVDSNPIEEYSIDVKKVSSDTDNCTLQQVEAKLSETQKHVKLMKDVMSSLRECEKSGKPIPIEHLRVLVDLDKDSDCEIDSEIDSETMIRDNNPSESGMNQAKVVGSSILPTGDHEQEETSSLGAYNTEFVARRKKDFTTFVSDYNQCAGIPPSERKKSSSQLKELSTFQSQLHGFMEMSADRRNEDVRSSGEGGYIPNRNSENRSPLDHVQSVRPVRRHQDNLLLTRQNVATMESQNQSCSRNLHSRAQSSKKDNINNLSGKMEKLSIQNSMNGPFAQIVDIPKDNIDSVSTLSSELNQSRSGETERKTIIDILTRGKKKQVYDRNRDNHIHSNSSIDSEPLECSNSALAVDTTVAATWGGSSTQENFEDETEEPSRNLQRQHLLEGASGSSYRPVPKLKKISKMGPLRGTTSGSSYELPNSASCSTETTKDYQQQISTHFIQQLRKQINQLNVLCQEELLNEGPQTSMNFNPNLLASCQPHHAANDIIHPYNQQLLLCLSQCYHTLYLQQLEIQNLHRYIRHNIDSEVIHQANNLNSQGNNGEDFEFRPWCMSACSNPLMPSNMYPNDQVPPRPTATYLQLPMKSYPPHSAPVAGTRPVRAVIHPASQENRTAQETLNNQVPPRTRANNFWDNFRSYSRQNLLSTSNTVKRNENIGLPVAPQIRQVHPMVSNGNMNSGPELTNSLSSSLPSDLNRSIVNPDRHLPNQHCHDIPVALNPSKKPNASAPTFGQVRYSAIHKKDSVANTNSSGVQNLRSEHYRAQGAESHPISSLNPSSVNLIQLQAIPDESKVGNFSSICPTSGRDSASSHSSSDAQNSHHRDYDYSDFLIGLYKETKALKSDVQRQQALKMIREIAISEKPADNEFTGICKIRNDHAVSSNKSERAASAPVAESSFIDTSANACDPIDTDKPSSRLPETNLPWTNQNLPTAAISPLSKQATPKSVSTGAVRKKPKLQSTCFWDSLSNVQNCSNSQENEPTLQDFNVSSLQPIRENHPDFSRNIVENIILDLQSDLPFGQMKEDSSDSFWSSINAYIISRIRANMNVPLPHKSLASLRQSLDHLTSEMKFCYNETDFLKCISQLLYDSLTCFMTTGRFTTSPSYTSLPDGSSVLDSNDKTDELSVKMPADIDDKTQELSINMPPDDVFLPQFQAVLPQNIMISTTETEDNINNIHPICAAASEEEVKCEWEPEAETEPEVEAGTEADLAEADQSPGQQGNISSTSLPVADSLPVDQPCNSLRSVPSSSNATVNVTESGDTADTTEVILGAHCCPDSSADPEMVLDDVPTKLCSSEEEPEKLEQSSQLPSDNTEENSELLPESKSENDATSTK